MAKVIVYTKDYCPYCDRAKALLEQKGQEYQEIKMSTSSDDFINLAQKTGMRTMPQIFVNDELIGGYTELAAANASGELDLKLKSEGN